MKLICRVFILVFVFSSCNKDDEIQSTDELLPRMDCIDIEEERAIIAEYIRKEGFILVPEEGCPVFRIDGDFKTEENYLDLWICNLPEEFQENNIEVIFSGYLYETFENEDVCAQIFELTEIKLRQ
ncbi:hypothetical protein SAMN04488033_10853 [Salegentibacter agarivorans]|uniref:Uncharacterized protein n=2 Tax=Salegentibacter TaxID=143222 RepID=A0A1I2LI02_9FLAO|nr:hypothetical protein [Salegentibacter agarivorans]SFF76696.1 hypothetical protein SAMN04488033_10853 [Salegentibacter agarivorans]